jgi:mRNA interferase MazF
VRGEVYRINVPSQGRGHAQHGRRFAVVVQSDALPLSTWIVCPTSTSAQPAAFRPEVDFGQGPTLVMADQAMAIDHQKLGAKVGYLSYAQLQAVDHALRLVLDLD